MYLNKINKSAYEQKLSDYYYIYEIYTHKNKYLLKRKTTNRKISNEKKNTIIRIIMIL